MRQIGPGIVAGIVAALVVAPIATSAIVAEADVQESDGAEADAADPAPFRVGEELAYDVRLLGIRAGEVELRVETGEPGMLHLLARGRSVGASETLFRLRQSASCVVTKQALAPQLCRFNSKRRGNERKRELRFDLASGEVRERIIEGDARKENVLRFEHGPNEIQEALSGLYLLRRTPPSSGAPVVFRAMRKGKPVTVEATYAGREELKVRAGRFAADRIDLRVLEKQGAEDTSTGKIWLSADTRRLPLQIELDAPVGSLRASLRAARGTMGAAQAELAERAPGS